MIPRPPRSTRTDTSLPCTTPCRSRRDARRTGLASCALRRGAAGARDRLVLRASLRRLLRDADAGLRAGRVVHRLPVVGGHQRRRRPARDLALGLGFRSEEHTSELQSLMRISYAVFCLKKKKKISTKI